MKRLLLLLVISGSFFLTSCKKSDSSTEPVISTDIIVGTWVSSGTNVPVGLQAAPFNIINIVATFNADKTYKVVQTDKNNVNTTLTGTYTNSASTYTDASTTYGTQGATIYNIVANQSSPTSVTATGIYAISGTGTGAKMTYEVIQTTPTITGVTAPNAAEGFGSYKYNNVKYAIYVQKYVKQ